MCSHLPSGGIVDLSFQKFPMPLRIPWHLQRSKFTPVFSYQLNADKVSDLRRRIPLREIEGVSVSEVQYCTMSILEMGVECSSRACLVIAPIRAASITVYTH